MNRRGFCHSALIAVWFCAPGSGKAESDDQPGPFAPAHLDAMMVRMPFTEAMARFDRFHQLQVSDSVVATLRKDLSRDRATLLGIASTPIGSGGLSSQSSHTEFLYRIEDWWAPRPQVFPGARVPEYRPDQFYRHLTQSQYFEWFLASQGGETRSCGFSVEAHIPNVWNASRSSISVSYRIEFDSYIGSRPRISSVKTPPDAITNAPGFKVRKISATTNYSPGVWHVAYRGVGDETGTTLEIVLLRVRNFTP